MKKLSLKTISATVSKVIHSSAFKHTLILGGLILVANTAYAGGEAGTAGIEAAAASFKQYQGSVSNLCKAIAAVIAVVGAFNIYFKMQNGDQDVKKTIMMTVGGCVAFIAASQALPQFFN